MFNITDTIATISPSAPSRQAAGGSLAQISIDWRQLISVYISQKECSPSSHKAYSKALVPFFKWLDREKRVISNLTETDILDYKNYLLESGHAPMTVSLYMVSLKGFYEWAEANKLYPNIARGVKTLRKDQMGDKFIKMHLNDDQGAMLLNHFRESESPRDYALINLMIRTGLRSVEVNRANIGDICVKGKHTILKVQGKGKLDKSDFVVLSPSALGPLEDYLESIKEERRIESAPEELLEKAFKPVDTKSTEPRKHGYLSVWIH